MRRASAATRPGRRPRAPSVALFPFLAVLVCTMGALIVLLSVLARQARIQAARAATAKAAEVQDDLAVAREMARWRVDQLARSSQRARAELAETRLKLGHVEDHSRQLRQQLARVQEAWKELAAAKSQDGRKRQELEAEIARLQGEIARAQGELDTAQRTARGRVKSYAVVPYGGPNGTRRRPIYLECRADGVILQPEGIELVESDFEGPLEAGNPLDRAMRAAREALFRQGQIKADGSDEPYPLLVVRPDGIGAYYAARAAIKSWKGEIGYELIGGDWKLEFPKPDPELTRTLRTVVDQARAEQRQRRALLAMASGGGPQVTYRAAPGGGLIREVRPGGAAPSNSEARPAASPDARRSPPAGDRAATSRPFGDPPAGTSRPGAERPGSSRPLPEDTIPADPMNKQDRPTRREEPGQVLRPGEWTEQPSSPPPKPPEEKKKAERDKTKSLAETRGRNWGLPDAGRGSVGVSRTIRIGCYPDRLEMLPDSGDVPSQIIPLGRRTEDFIDALVSAVWEHMQSWGIAGRGMYWRPILAMEVAPQAESRFAEIQGLLEGSGLDVRRKAAEIRAAAKPQAAPPTIH